MKNNYEDRTRYSLPLRTYTILRIDGKAFHTYTKNCYKPFDDGLIDDMNNTAAALCKEVMGAKLAYVQSDEISLLLTDFATPTTQAWFDGNIQKICSVSASIATATFNMLRFNRWNEEAPYIDEPGVPFKLAHFDSRVFTIPDVSEVANYFLWRTQDAIRNSIQTVARSLYSHRQCDDKNSSELQEMIFQKGTNWNDLPSKYKTGRLIIREATVIPNPYPNWKDNPEQSPQVLRHEWRLGKSIPKTDLYNFYKELINECNRDISSVA